MLYRTIALGLLESSPMYDQLRREKKLLDTMNQLAEELEQSHRHHWAALAKARPDSDPSQISTEAMEMAVADLEAFLPTLLSHLPEVETVSRKSLTARVRPPARSLFDGIPPPSHPAAPQEPFDGTVSAEPDGTMGNGHHFPLPHCTDAALPSAADSSVPQAPLAGQDGGNVQQLAFQLPLPEEARAGRPPAAIASGEKAKARDIIAAIRTLKAIEEEHRPATDGERQILARFGGFGPVALSIFPDPIRGTYKDGWQPLGEELKTLLTPEEYDSVKRTTFCAFYTAPTVMRAMHEALGRLGVNAGATVLEPGAGIGNFMGGDCQPSDRDCKGYRWIGVELDSISGRIARALYPQADIRIENFRDSKLPQLDAVIGNVPFADVKMEHNGQKFSLHNYFIAKSMEALKPGGVLAVVTSHFTLDSQNAAAREYLAERADFLGAIRLPSDAFKREGTSVVTDIVFLRKRAPGEVCKHCDPEWIQTGPLCIEGANVAVNKYFLNHPEQVLGTWSRKDTLYGEGFSVTSNGDLARIMHTLGQEPLVE